MWTILKTSLDLLQYYFQFMFWFLGCEACGILVPQPGIEPTFPGLESGVLTASEVPELVLVTALPRCAPIRRRHMSGCPCVSETSGGQKVPRVAA